MSALHFAKQAFGREKPHSSITDWVEILTTSGIEDEAYDGIPELVDSINLQAAGPAEASRALRKKLKHGNAHQQYRALVLLKALVENCGSKFTSSFADGHLTDAIKNLSADNSADKKVRKKLMAVLASWHDQFKNDPSMATVANLYRQCNREGRRQSYQEVAHLIGMPLEDKQREEKEEAKRAAKRAKEQAKERKAEEERQQRLRQRAASQPQRAPFVFEKEKPKVLASIVEASQASSNLVNAITLVPQTDDIRTNERVQECLTKAKLARKPVIRYIQLVENEELIGTLIETNERIMAALEKYEKVLAGEHSESPDDLSNRLASTHMDEDLTEADYEHTRHREFSPTPDLHVHPDLQDLNFGPLGASSSNLPPPLRPSALSDDDVEEHEGRGSLSDFSDYSSDEETHVGGASQKRTARNYVTVSDAGGEEPYSQVPLTKQATGDDPFADPFADEVALGPSRKW
ncbi:hypothetical protein H0H92_000172 [Tricholoma furcatifolium]|nr:hypothetical protein H0H92_000172 [Tricholoma furcatifolium]